MKKGGLGKGLSSLIPNKSASPTKTASPKSEDSHPRETVTVVEEVPRSERILKIPVGDIAANPFQPRREFHAEELGDLVSSIRDYGVLQPLVVTEKENGMFELIAGERRLRASKQAGLRVVPAILRTAEAQEKLELALIENIQRSDLSPIEEAHSYAQLMEEFGLTQERVAARVGKSRPVIANTLRLLKLPDDMQKALSDGEISMSMARVLVGMNDMKEQRAMYDRMIKGEYTVREAETDAREKKKGPKRKSIKDVNLLAMEEELRGKLSTKVVIDRKNGKGKILLEFYSDEELDELHRKLASI